MKKAKKKTGKKVVAFKIEKNSERLQTLEKQGKIQKIDGGYEVYSLEAKNVPGEVAFYGDYIKLDSNGNPYPNKKNFFEENHIKIPGEQYLYEQIPQPVDVWDVSEPMCDEIEFLIRDRGLVIDESNKDEFFSAPLWGTILSAEKTAKIIFYRVTRDEFGNIIDADFNFVQKEEFERTYDLI
jgi:hypothetical protein